MPNARGRGPETPNVSQRSVQDQVEFALAWLGGIEGCDGKVGRQGCASGTYESCRGRASHGVSSGAVHPPSVDPLRDPEPAVTAYRRQPVASSTIPGSS